MLKLMMVVIYLTLILCYGSGSVSGYKLNASNSMPPGYQTGGILLGTSLTAAIPTDSASVTTQLGSVVITSTTHSAVVPSNTASATSTHSTSITVTPAHKATMLSNSAGAASAHSISSIRMSSSSGYGTPVSPRIHSSVSSSLNGINATYIQSSAVNRLSTATPSSTIQANVSLSPIYTPTNGTKHHSTHMNTSMSTTNTMSPVYNSSKMSNVSSTISTTHVYSSFDTSSATATPAVLSSAVSIKPSTNTGTMTITSSYFLPSNVFSSTVTTSSLPSVPATNAFSAALSPPTSISTIPTQAAIQSTSPVVMVTASSSLPTVQSVTSPSSSLAFSMVSVSPTTGLTYLIPTAPTVVFPAPVKFGTTPTSPTTTTGSTPSVPSCLLKHTCCVHGLQQLPASIMFKESLHPGSVLARMKGVMNVSMAMFVVNPPPLLTILQDYFTIAATGDDFSLVLNHELDLEEVYLKANKKMDVHQFQIQFHCSENGVLYPSQLINVTVEDVDDSMPEFQHDGTGPSCVVPVYKAAADEEYTGELQISPGKIKAIDGDLTQKHNISYNVMHAEPDDYHAYFYVDTVDGTVNKTRTMNSSDPRKFVIFVKATEDSPNQKNRVAILSIEVFAPLADNERPITVNPAVKSALQIISALLIIAFISGFLVILHHRWRLRKTKVGAAPWDAPGSEQDVRMPKLAVYKSSSSSINTLVPDIPVITSPSHVELGTRDDKWALQKHRKKIIVVKRPLDTRARPSWNAPPPRAKKVSYNPYVAVQNVKNQ